MRAKRFWLTLIAVWMACAALAPAAIDLSSPKSAARSFVEAMNNADSAAMRDCMLAEGEDQQKLAGAFIDVILAGKKLAEAAKDKFGPSGEKIAAGTLGREDAAAIDNAIQSETGGDVSLKLTKKSKPLKFRKTPGGWKLIVLDNSGEKPEALPEQIKTFESLAAAMNDTTDDIVAGRFPTSADAESAIQQRFSEVMVKRYKPATTQGSQEK